jgi:hypothetical protein
LELVDSFKKRLSAALIVSKAEFHFANFFLCIEKVHGSAKKSGRGIRIVSGKCAA